MKSLLLKKVLLLIMIIFFGLQLNSKIVYGQHFSQLSQKDQCIKCHMEEEMMPKNFNESDIHLQAGLSCVGCHGGDSTKDDVEAAMNPLKGFIGVPSREKIPQLCGKCHTKIDFMRKYQPRIATDQLSQYYSSVHGKKFRQNDKKVAECVSCHTAHSILPASDPRSSVYALNVPKTCRKCHSNSVYMKEYAIPTDQYEVYSLSVHGEALLKKKDIGAPACNDCHGNHGAAPPGTASVSHICGSCHINNMEFFKQTRMARAFEGLHFHGCEQCHGYHSIQKASDSFIGVSESSFCLKCHESGDKGFQAAQEIGNQITTLVNVYNAAQMKLLEVQKKGMNDEEINFTLQEAKQNLIQSRTLVHTFDPNKIGNKTQEGITKAKYAIDLGEKEIDEYYTRRNGFAAATLAFLVLAIALYFKIKDKEKNKTTSNS